MLAALALLALYGTLAGAALWATWPDRALFWVGFWLLGDYLISNSMWVMGVAAVDRPGIYTGLEVLVSVSTFCAWDRKRRVLLILLVATSALSVCANVAFASIVSPALRQIHAWQVTTNLCFAAECLLAIGVGVSHGIESGRFTGRFLADRLRFAPHVARAAEEPHP